MARACRRRQARRCAAGGAGHGERLRDARRSTRRRPTGGKGERPKDAATATGSASTSQPWYRRSAQAYHRGANRHVTSVYGVSALTPRQPSGKIQARRRARSRIENGTDASPERVVRAAQDRPLAEGGHASGARGRSRSSLSTTARSAAVSISFKLPSVIRLLRYIKIKRRFDYVPFSRANIYARDDHRCQYCGDGFPTSELTFDHVVPVAQGGRKDWENIVTCCVTCNRRKGGRTPAEAGMHLLRRRSGPSRRRPSASPSASATRPTAGATTSTGTSSSTIRKLERSASLDQLERRACPPITSIRRCAIEGGRITIDGAGFPVDGPSLPEVRIGDAPARVVFASPTRLVVDRARRARRRPGARARRRRRRRDGVRRRRRAVRDRPAPGGQPGLRSRRQPLRHLQRHARAAGAGVDFPRAARTARARRSRRASSTRRRWRSIRRAGSTSRAASRARSIACGRDGSAEPFATDLGVACGLAFAPDGTLFVGDRSGTIFRVDRDGRATTFATLPASVAAFHLAIGPDGALYVTGPTLVVVRRAVPHRRPTAR